MNYHPSTEIIKNLLLKNKCWFEAFEHEAVKTSEEAAKLRPNYSLHQGAKAMIVQIKVQKKAMFVMLVLPGDLKFDSKKVKALLQTKDLRFATEEEIEKLTEGIKIGGVPPFGNLFGLEVIADPSLFDNEKIIFNAGDRRFSIAMKSQDFKNLVNPQIVPII